MMRKFLKIGVLGFGLVLCFNPLAAFAVDEPKALHCFEINSPHHTGGIALEYTMENEVYGFGYGNVTTNDGAMWSYLANYEGMVAGKVLTLERYVLVDGDQAQESLVWRVEADYLQAENSRYKRADCKLINAEIVLRFPPVPQ